MFRYNIIKLLVITVLGLFALVVNGCEHNFDSLNTPTDRLTTSEIDDATLGQVFADAQYWGLVGNQAGWELMHELHASIFSQTFATTSSGFDTDQYLQVPGWVNSGWNSFYSGPAVSINFVKDFTEENNMPVEHAIARIWEVPIFGRMTDFFGPIMYSEFGNEQTSVPYDSQEEIYYSFFDQLDSAINTLENNRDAVPFGDNDIIFSGDVNKWIAFANSLRLRLAVRISYVEPERARQEAEKAIESGVITDNMGNALISTTPNNLNYLTRWTYINPFSMSATSESILKGFEDPRLQAFWNEGGGRLGGDMGYNGLRNGLPRILKTTDVRSGVAGNSFVSDRFLPIADGGENPPVPVVTAAEVFFLRAEGALRGWDMGGGTPEEYYNKGIEMSLKYWTDASDEEIQEYVNSTNTPSAVPDNVVDANFNSPPQSDITVRYDNTSNDFERNLEQIITQKWIDSFLNPMEAWAERRRTGYPKGYAIIESLNPNISETDIIRRLSYPPAEFSNNRSSVEEAINNLLDGPDEPMTRLWWDKKDLSTFPDLSNTEVDW